MINPIAYTSRTFNSVYADINSDAELIDKPDWWKRAIAGIADVLSMYINATANQSVLRTAFTNQAVRDLCALINYNLSPQTTSTGMLLFYLNADAVSFPKTISQANLKALSSGSLTSSSKYFEATSAETMNATSETFTTNFAVNSLLTVGGTYIYYTGEKVRVTGATSLPAPLVAGTDYYTIYSSATKIYLATTLTNALAGTKITLTGDGVGTQTIKVYNIRKACYQQTTIPAPIAVGISDGTTVWQEYNMPDLNILQSTVVVSINSVTWTRVTNFASSGSGSTHYMLLYKSDGASYLLFGNGVYGKVPGHYNIMVTYATGGGVASNILQVNKINSYAGSDSDVTGVYNPSTFIGGTDPESMENAKRVAPLLLLAQGRFITVSDGIGLSEGYAGIQIAQVMQNSYGLMTCTVYIVPNGGGLPTGSLKTALQAYLAPLTLPGVTVYVEDPTYVATSITAGINMKTGFVFATYLPYITLAFRLFLSEMTREIQDDYYSYGIASAVAMINTHWSTAFTSADYSVIQTLLENVTPADFGDSIAESEISAYVQTFVPGINYLTISAPTFPVTITAAQISQDNINPALIVEIP